MGWVKWANANNGEIPDSLTVEVGPGLRLNPAAADAFHAWDAEFFERTGIHIVFSETDRNIARQEYLYDGYSRRLPGFFPAADPHTSSHGEDTAGDVFSYVYSGRSELHDILVETGHNHGWSWELVGRPSGEPWHFNFIGDPLGVTVAEYNAKYNTIQKEEDDMALSDTIKSADGTEQRFDVIVAEMQENLRDLKLGEINVNRDDGSIDSANAVLKAILTGVETLAQGMQLMQALLSELDKK